ncbi:PHP domain-containing protein [Bacillus sp. FJAT-45350]|uniref:PHP domain-containing protein n=1 Tax=Bacillus sp. FJAT-45350 TaxID=2011014 RepID=UPI000BB7489D|nr:PHP domain-containing protein [Bacillus sp. FJAT-45350]
MEPKNNNADLHMHSTASDGGYTPSELMKKCAEVGLEIVALTDHDTMEGIAEAVETGKQLGLTVIPGIEFSTKYAGKSVHVLGYGLEQGNEELQKLLTEQQNMRRERLDTIIKKLHLVGIKINPEDVLEFVDGGSIGRPHVAKALVKHGYVKDVAEAFEKYLAEGKPCYVGKEKEMTPEEAIGWIHECKGVAILAHPVYYNLDEAIEIWVKEYHLDGVEVFHRDHTDEDRIKYNTIINNLENSSQIKLLKTGGSDFHHEDYGRVKEPLGITRVSNRLAEELIEAIKVRR